VIIFAVALIVTARGRMRRPSTRSVYDRVPVVGLGTDAAPAPGPRPASTR
jgi:hypothetical protein